MPHSALSRRHLLKAGGALVVGFVFDAALPRTLTAQSRGATTDPSKPLDPAIVDSFLAIHADGSATVYSGKVDIGTGMRIAVAQMVAEEIGLPVARISVIDGDTGLCPDQGGTGGSNGLTRGGMEIRRAAATARRALLTMGADRLQRPAADLTIEDGQVRPLAGGAGVSIVSLVGDRQLSVNVDPNVTLVAPAKHTVIGKPLPRPDVVDKCTARHVYVQDFRLPGMLHGRVIRPPAVGATLESIEAASLFGIPDVRIVRIENFLGVVAKDEWAAVRAAAVLKATWTDAQTLSGHAELARHVREGAIDRDQDIVNTGDTADALRGAVKTLSATYFWPNQSHAPLGPSCAVADVRDDGATVWSSSQGTHGLRANLAKVFGLEPSKVRVVFLEGSGSYGTSGYDHAAADAVLLSKTVGQPVRVQWSRQDELRWDPKGPQQLLDLRAGLDASGRIVAWDTQMWLPTTRPGARAFLAADAAGIAQEHGMSSGLLSQNGDPPYETERVRVVAHWLKETPLVPSNLRAPGKIANVFAVESFTDEIAAAAGVDPVAFRLKRLSDARAVEVVTRTAQAFGWKERPSPNSAAKQGTLLAGRGVAYMRYKQAENYVAMAMDVTVDPASGRIAVTRVVCAHDCGLIVNPDALKNQIEGCIVQTISRTLHEEVKFDRSRVISDDFASYPILRFPEAPAVEVILIDRPDQPLMGAGEAATAPVAAAIGNAVFDATGVRLRTVPFTPDRVKGAIASASKGSSAGDAAG
ncbi:MAG: xanthine dehydrogenase family protein molybdopterin-binding subunit [Acidobacteria bacterium]|nr:xanthine dehydrogenase family protein molybdopterin-binding subunit [Acidobacteriota bacterium]